MISCPTTSIGPILFNRRPQRSRRSLDTFSLCGLCDLLLKRVFVLTLTSFPESPVQPHHSDLDTSQKSGGGPPHSRMLARVRVGHESREASWSAPALWRFGTTESAAPRPESWWTELTDSYRILFRVGNSIPKRNPVPILLILSKHSSVCFRVLLSNHINRTGFV